MSDKKMTRRQFLKGTTAGAAAVAIGVPYIIPRSVLGENGRPAASDRIVLGGIGMGGMGRGDLSNLMSRPQTQVVAVCDVDTEHREMARDMVNNYYAQEKNSPWGGYKGCAAYNDFRELLARPDIDAVVIATPDHWHALIAVAAAKAGKDMYCEKPLTLAISQGRIMSDTIARYGRIFQTGSQQRSDRDFRFACELARNGRLGKLQTIEVGIPRGVSSKDGEHLPMPIPKGFDYDMWLGPAPWAPYTKGRCHFQFRQILDYSGGLVTDWGAHHMDIAQWGNDTEYSGPIEVEGVGEFPTEGLYNAVIDYRFVSRYKNGVELICWNDYPNGVRFVGPDGWVFVTRGYIDAKPKSLLDEVIGPNEVHLYESDDHHQNFIDCVLSRRQTVAPVEIAHRSITTCHLGNIAMRLGRKVQWDPDKEQFVNDPEADKMITRPMRAPWKLV